MLQPRHSNTCLGSADSVYVAMLSSYLMRSDIFDAGLCLSDIQITILTGNLSPRVADAKVDDCWQKPSPPRFNQASKVVSGFSPVRTAAAIN